MGNNLFARAVAVAVLLGAGCVPQSVADSGGARETPVAARKQLTIAIEREPDGLQEEIAGAGCRGGGKQIVCEIVQNRLVVENDAGAYVPQLALERISQEKGTWRVNPDGSMVTSWKIRPGIKWHDGAPFTSSDLLFALVVYKDREIPNAWGGFLNLMESATAPDPHTLVVHWSKPFANADRAGGLTPMARHAMEETYVNDKLSFVNSPRLTSEFIGLGPYRLANWERGSHMEFARHEDYYLSRPPLDSVILRFIGDANATVANALSGQVDVVPANNSIDLDAVRDIQRRWEGTGNQVMVYPSERIQFLGPQFRTELARPKHGLTELAVRRALYHAIDRTLLAEVITKGLAPIADSWFPPGHELRRRVEDVIPQYPYDVARAQQLLAQAGWTRGTDGGLTHGQTGDRFQVEIRGTSDTAVQQLQNVIRDNWGAVGGSVEIFVIPEALSRDRETRVTGTGVLVLGGTWESIFGDVLDGRRSASAATRWVGNRPGYANPRVDTLIDRLAESIDPNERVLLHREFTQEVMGDVAIMPLYWIVELHLVAKGVQRVLPGDSWNFFEWRKD